jgi:hypothetical protein
MQVGRVAVGEGVSGRDFHLGGTDPSDLPEEPPLYVYNMSSQSTAEGTGRAATICISDGSISGFQFRYDNDTIFTKYRDIDTISIYRYRSRYIDNSIYNDMK